MSQPKKQLLISLTAFAALFFASLHLVSAEQPRSQIPTLPETAYDYTPDLPLHLRVLVDTMPDTNPTTDAGATLGRVLFYDTRLSANNTTACASCHFQEHGFADPDPTSTGHLGEQTRRNSMGLANLRWNQAGLFWDERTPDLETLVLQPIEDPLEMGSSLPQLIVELEQTEFYGPLFEDAFGSDEISAETISRALAQFVRSMISYQSKYDAGALTDFDNFNALEMQGLNLFNARRGNCSLCHRTDIQTITFARNNGLDLVYTDNGLGEITGVQTDMARFRAPSLRNIAVTGPYMHDGRFATLNEVLNHYSSGIRNHPNLDKFLFPGGFNFSSSERAAFIAFFNTLTDDSFLTDEKFSNPFPETTPTAVATSTISSQKSASIMIVAIAFALLFMLTCLRLMRRRDRQ